VNTGWLMITQSRNSSGRRGAGAALGAIAWLVALVALGPRMFAQEQSAPGTVTGGFTVTVFDDQKRPSKLTGRSAKAIGGMTLFELEDVRLVTTRTNAEIDFIAETPSCRYDLVTKTVSSSGPFKVFSGDRRLEFSGTGFVFRQTNSSLVLSNDVRTVIRDLGTNTAAGTNAIATTNAAAQLQSLTITAAGLEGNLATKRVVYRDNVRVEESQMELTCGLLTALLGPKLDVVEAIEAERNVTIIGKADGSRIVATKARYTQTNETVELTGDASWKQGLREGRADRITLHRLDRSLRAAGGVMIKLPRDAAAQGGFLLGAGLATNAPTTNAPATDAPAAKPPVLVDVLADQFHSRSNLVVLSGSVRVIDGTNRVRCDKLTLRSATKTSPEETAEAEGGIVAEQGTARLTGEHALYTKSSSNVVFTGNPTWKMDQSEGSAARLVFFAGTNGVSAEGDVRMKLLRTTAGAALLPVPAASTNRVQRTNSPVEIACDRFELRGRTVRFTGNVRAHETPRTGAEPRMSCGELQILLAPKGGRAESASAAGSVVFEQGTRGATNGPAAYQRFEADRMTAQMSPATGQLTEMKAEGRVKAEHPNGSATAARAVYDAATDVVTLDGQAQATTPDLIIREAAALIWDRANHRFTAKEPFKMEFRPREDAGAATGLNRK